MVEKKLGNGLKNCDVESKRQNLRFFCECKTGELKINDIIVTDVLSKLETELVKEIKE